jgi:pyruvate dehydrogenase E1 component
VKKHVQLLGCGAIFNEVRAAAMLLRDDFGVSSDVWSVTSFNELARDGQHIRRWNMLHPDEPLRQSYVTECLQNRPGPVVASTDYIKLFAEQIRAFVPSDYSVLGTDGFGRSDTREKLRHFFEVDRYYVTVAALEGLALRGQLERSIVVDAMRKYNIDRNTPDPATL